MKVQRGLAFGALLMACCSPAGAVETDSRLSGAWATSQADCQKLFVRSGGALAYRQPVDKFAQAAIITPGAFAAPGGTCQVRSSSRTNAVIKFELECKDTISYTSQTVEIEIRSATEIVYRPNGDKTLDTALVRCRL